MTEIVAADEPLFAADQRVHYVGSQVAHRGVGTVTGSIRRRYYVELDAGGSVWDVRETSLRPHADWGACAWCPALPDDVDRRAADGADGG